ncbi:MAG: hypothetical protein DWI22_06085 [Planctomycetota bacterium]|nr:MAG: hypothetical protein DWI22_06085 [Planctomycetota bacterium]
MVAWQATLKRKKFTTNMRHRSIKVLGVAFNRQKRQKPVFVQK